MTVANHGYTVKNSQRLRVWLIQSESAVGCVPPGLVPFTSETLGFCPVVGNCCYAHALSDGPHDGRLDGRGLTGMFLMLQEGRPGDLQPGPAVAKQP